MEQINANNMVPFSMSPTLKEITSTYSQAAGTEPKVEGVTRDRSYPIIVVPGIMGSRLFDKKGGLSDTGVRQVWPPVYKPKTDVNITGSALQSEELAIENTLYTVDYTIEQREFKKMKPEEVTYVVNNSIGLNNINGREYGAAKAYENLVNKLCNEFSDREIFFFLYDWRQSNSHTSSCLKDFINSLQTDKIDLVCHSMGGLVTGHFLSINSSNINSTTVNTTNQITYKGNCWRGEFIWKRK